MESLAGSPEAQGFGGRGVEATGYIHVTAQYDEMSRVTKQCNAIPIKIPTDQELKVILQYSWWEGIKKRQNNFEEGQRGKLVLAEIKTNLLNQDF